MKIGFSTTCTFPLSLEKSFAMGKYAGYDGIEIMVTSNKYTRDVNYLKMLEEKYELPILSFHAPTLLLTHFVWGTDPAVKLQKTSELAAEIGAGTVVVHPPFTWQGKYSENFLPLVEKISQDTNVTIAVENMFPWKVKGKTLTAYYPSWETIVQQTPALTLDFSHAALSNENSLEIAKNFHHKIKHVHLCDGTNSNDQSKDKIFDEHLLPGQGNQPVAETLTFLKSVNWDGSVVAEINTKNARSSAERFSLLKETLEWTRDILHTS